MATALLDLEHDRIVLESLWRERELCQQVPGCHYDDVARIWHCPLSWASCCALRGVFGDGLQVSDELSEYVAREYLPRVEQCLALREAVDSSVPVYRNGDLEPMQRAGVQFLATAHRALCGDGMGSGKTVESICTVEHLAAQGKEVFPALVICTNSMVYKWAEELSIWSPGRSVAVLKGGAATRRKLIAAGADWYVINWEGLLGHSRLTGYGSIALTDKDREEKELNGVGLRTVIADEAHRGKNPKAKQTRAWWYLSHHADVSLGLTGTPIIRSPEDLWSIMHGICPREWPAKTPWVSRYGLLSWNPFGGMAVVGVRGDTQDELFRFLDPRFIRRPTPVVLPNLAPKLPPQYREIEMTPKQATAYKQMRDDMIAEVEGGYLMASTVLVRMGRLIQLAASYGEVAQNPDGSEDFVMTDPSCCVDAMMDVVDELDDDPLVVFAVNRQLIELASKRLTKEKIDHGIITGAVSPLDRTTFVNRFQAGELPVMLCTIDAGGEGLTLTRACHSLFLQRHLSAAKNHQAEDREYRRGQERPVQPIILVPKNTVVKRVLQIGHDKDMMLEEIARDKESLLRWLGS